MTVVMHHPKLKREHDFQSSQVRVMEKSGWKVGPIPKRKRVEVEQPEQKENG